MSEQERIVWTYWDGPVPAYIELCWETMRRHERDVRLVSAGTLESLTGFKPDNYFMEMKPAHRADIARVLLLRGYGGCWLDSDFIMLNNFEPLFRLADDGAFLCYHEHADHPTNGLIVAAKGNMVVEEWHRKVQAVYQNHRLMQTPPQNLPWTSFGADQLKVIWRNRVTPWVDLGFERVQLVPFEQKARFFTRYPTRKQARLQVWTASYGYMLFNNMFPAHFKSMSRQEILEGDMMISSLFRVALGMEE